MTTPLTPDFNAVHALTAGVAPQKQAPAKPNTVQQALGSKPLPIPQGKPDPVLQAAGFHGGTGDFVSRVKATVQAHQDATGQPPSPHLVLDVARSSVPTDAIPGLFKVPKDTSTAKAAGVLATHQQTHPDDFFIQRSDGFQQPDHPIRRILEQHGVTPVLDDKALKRSPWVPYASMALPIPNGSQFKDALDTIEATATPDQVKAGGDTLPQFQKQVDLAKGDKPLSQLGGFEPKMQYFGAVETVKQAQQYLKNTYPDYFGDLSPSGTWTQDWSSAQGKFASSATYADAWTKKLTKDNYFGSDTQEFIKAWHKKNDVLKNDQTGVYHLALATPLAFFGDADSVRRYLTQTKGAHVYGDHWYDAIALPLNTIKGVAKTAFAGSAGLYSTFKATAVYGSKLYETLGKEVLAGKGPGLNEATDQAFKAFHENPTWLRIVYPDLAEHPTGDLALVDQASNLALDLLIGRKAIGREIRPGNVQAFNDSRYVQTGIDLAFNSMRRRGLGGVGEAAKVLQGGDQLHAAVAAGIKDGTVSRGAYGRMVSDLFHTGKTELPDGRVINAADNPNNPLLRSIWSAKTHDPSLAAKAVRQHLDHLDSALRDSPKVGTANVADALSSLRSLFAHAAPHGGEPLLIEDTRTPERIYNWAVRQLGDRAYANKVRNDFVVARAADDIPAITKLNEQLVEKYAAKYPNRQGRYSPIESEGPLTESEARSYFRTPAQRERSDENVIDRIITRSHNWNQNLLKIGQAHRQIIISGAAGPVPFPGGESLFWKHAVADTLRRYAGGAGLKFGLSADQKVAKAEVDRFLIDNPAAGRDLSVKRAASKMGEFRWLTNQGAATKAADFSTAEHFNDAARMQAAGAYLRHLVTDDALNAYRASTPDDKSPLFRFVWGSRLYQNRIVADERFKAEAAQVTDALTGKARTAALSDLKKFYANEIVDNLWNSYREIDKNGALDRAQQTFVANLGAKADDALAKLVRDQKLEFSVRDPLIQQNNKFDAWSQWWIGKLLTFNKANRQQFFDHAFYDTYSELRKAGWEQADAVTTASDLAKFQTVYHMLDFSNMLQVEQNLRWLSYYATKHRLYWTWILGQFSRRPGLAGAVNDIRQALDPNGNLNFTVHGVKVTIPASRLVWANSTEYPEVAPPLTFGSDVFTNLPSKGVVGAFETALADQTATSGNVISRQDQWIMSGLRLATTPKTYQAATAGMSPVQLQQFNRTMHAYILSYRAHHDGDYPPEADAVQEALWHETAQEFYRANLFLPAYFAGQKPSEFEKLQKQFTQITSPAKRRKFLDDHPAFADTLGATQDQGVYLHEAPLWEMYRRASEAFLQTTERLHDQMLKDGWSAQLAAEYRAAKGKRDKVIDQIRLQDAQSWAGNATYPAGKVQDGQVVTPGTWGAKFDGDPTASRQWLHEMFPGISQKNLDQHTIGETVAQLQAESDRIRQAQRNNTLSQMGYTDQTARDRLAAISQKIAVFNAIPKNAVGKTLSDYYNKYVTPFRKQRDGEWAKKLAAAKGTPAENEVYAEFRAWKEQHDLPVTVDGVKFPPPARYGFQLLPPDIRKQDLATAASSDAFHVATYELQALGVKAPNSVADAISALEQLKTLYKSDPAYAGTSLAKQQIVRAIKVIDRGYPNPLPGFPNGIKPHPGFFSFYVNYASLPKIDRFERTTLYTGMDPQAKQQFDELVGQYAVAGARLIRQNGSANYYGDKWKTYINEIVKPELEQPQYKALAAELKAYPPSFLYTLLSQ